MAKLHYWVSFGHEDDDETSLSTLDPLVTLATATRDKSDTLLRSIAWAQLRVTVAASAAPVLDWLAGAAVDFLYVFDTESDSHPVNIVDNDPYMTGFQRLNLTVHQTPTTNVYVANWQGPAIGLNLEGTRKGYSASNLPSLSIQRWVSDNHGVFDNFTSRSVTFTSRLVGRALWASDFPAP